MNAPDALDDLRAAVASLGGVLGRERAAIAALDVGAMRACEDEKHLVAARISELLAHPLPPDPRRRSELLSLVRRARNDLHANALLVASAAEAVAALLGLEEAATYDHRARRHATTRPIRTLTAL